MPFFPLSFYPCLKKIPPYSCGPVLARGCELKTKQFYPLRVSLLNHNCIHLALHKVAGSPVLVPAQVLACKRGELESRGRYYKVDYNGELAAEKTTKKQRRPEEEMQSLIVEDHQDAVSLVKACAQLQDLPRGIRVHTDIIRRGLLEKDVSLSSSLISMYAKCGALEKAQEVFDNSSAQNLSSRNALITAYVQHGNAKKALNLFEQMQREGFFPDSFTYSCILKACGSLGALEKGQEIHSQILKGHLLETDTIVGNAIVGMYAKCGALDLAQEVFNELKFQDAFSWNALIGGYAQHGRAEEALGCFKWMQELGFSPDVITFACILKACGSIGASENGQEIHADIVKRGVLDHGIALGTALVDMYCKCGALESAQAAFDELPTWDVVSWNALIAGYAQHEHGEDALGCFEQMQLEGFYPNAVTLSCILNACGSIGGLAKGQEIHSQILQNRLLSKDIVLGTGLIDMYAKCGVLVKAQEVFDELPAQDVVLWNALIAGYAQHGYGREALICFEKMQCKGFFPNAVSFICILKACGNIGAAGKGQELHAQLERKGMLNKDTEVANALIDMYAKCDMLEKAQEVFYELQFRDATSWNVLISGYALYEHDEEALNCFNQMQLEGFSPNAVTFSCILKACGSVGLACKGQKVHTKIVTFGLLDDGMIIGTALVVMYANCGMLAEAQASFDELPDRDVVAWSALMEGYAQTGRDEIIFDLFGQMRQEGTEPSSVTFTIVLNACSHGGLLDKSQMYFEVLSNVYGIIPTLEHYTCIIDLFGRAGHLDITVAMMKEMPASISLAMWHTLLAACQNWGNMELGRRAFEYAVLSDDKNASAYVALKNVYAANGRPQLARTIEATSWLHDPSGVVHSFSIENKAHP